MRDCRWRSAPAVFGEDCSPGHAREGPAQPADRGMVSLCRNTRELESSGHRY